jgi:hypothetical protein
MKPETKQPKPLSIYDLAKIAFNVSEGIDAYYLMYAYYKQMTGQELPKAVSAYPKEQEALRLLLKDLVISGNGITIKNQLMNDNLLVKPKLSKELSPMPDWYDFAFLRELIIIVYQELDFNISHERFKVEWVKLNNNKPIPFPLWDDKQMYDSMIATLQNVIDIKQLTKPKYPVKLRKKIVKEKYGWSEKIFEKFYSQPFEIKRFQPEGSPYFVTSYIYDGNVIDDIVETEEYQLFIHKKSKK